MEIWSKTETPSSLEIDRAALGFAACGSESRLAVLRLLVRAGEKGLAVGQIQQRSGLPASTLAHHLKTLSESGLIQQERHGRSIISRAVYRQVKALAAYLLEECCADAGPLHSKPERQIQTVGRET